MTFWAGGAASKFVRWYCKYPRMKPKPMPDLRQNGGIRTWARLRTRMAVSYVTVTLVIVLLLESLVVAAVFYM